MKNEFEINGDFGNSTAETIANQLRQQILDGKLKAGTKLKEEELCAKFHVSRTPLREAFRMLQSEKLLTYTRYVGVSVSQLSTKFLEDNWDIRALLESYATKLVVLNGRREDIDELYKLKKIMLNIQPDEIKKFSKYDRIFHLSIAKMSGNQELENLINRMWDNALSLRIIAVQNKNRIERSCKEHAAVIQAIHERDVKSAVQYMNEHLERSKIDIFDTPFFKNE